MDELNLAIIQICQHPQILVLALIRERVHAFVTIMEMSKENIRAYMQQHSNVSPSSQFTIQVTRRRERRVSPS